MTGHHQTQTRHTLTNGFTIVELLIVIFVIAILAAIITITYTGVQQRANNSATIESVAAYARTLQAYAAQNSNSYPIATYFPCLGPNGSQCANVTDTTNPCNGTGSTSYSATFDAAVHTVASSLPAPSQQRIACNGKMYVGAYYYSSDGKSASLTYFLANTTDCGSPGGTISSGNYTFAGGVQCYTNLPGL